MAKETTGSNYEAPLFSNTAMDSLKEFWGFQMKIGQTLTEQTMKMGETWSDFAYNQFQSAAKVSHECVKQGMGIAEDVRKGWTHITDKVTKA